MYTHAHTHTHTHTSPQAHTNMLVNRNGLWDVVKSLVKLLHIRDVRYCTNPILNTRFFTKLMY